MVKSKFRMRGLVSKKTKLDFAQLNTQNVKLKTRIRSSPRRFQHYLEKELIKVGFFYRRDSHYEKEAFESAAFGCVWPGATIPKLPRYVFSSTKGSTARLRIAQNERSINF